MIVKHLLSCNSGELSPRLSARTDFAKYESGCRVLENFICTSTGAAIRRPGLEHLMACETPTACTYARLVPMQIATDNHAVLVMWLQQMRVIVNRVPQPVIAQVDAEDVARIPIPWTDADLPTVKFRQINDVIFCAHPGYPPYRILRLADDSWRIEEIAFGAGAPMLPGNTVDEHTLTVNYAADPTVSAWAGSTTSGGEKTYAAGDRVTRTVSGSLKTFVAQAAHTSWATGNAWGKPSSEPPVGTYSYLVWDPHYDPITGYLLYQYTTVTAPTWAELVLTAPIVPGQTVALTSSRPLFTAAHVGSAWRLDRRRDPAGYEVGRTLAASSNGTYSPILEVQGEWNLQTSGTWEGYVAIEISEDNGATWRELRRMTSSAGLLRNYSAGGTVDKRSLMRTISSCSTAHADAQALLSVADGYLESWVKITAVTDSQTAAAVALGDLQTHTTNRWAEGAWSAAQGYPRCVELHQGRLCYAGTRLRPHTLWGSAVDDYYEFSGGTKASDSYAHTLVIGERDPLLWMVSDRFLMLGSGGAEFIIHGETENAPITPEHGVVRRQSTMGTDSRGVCAIVSETVPLFIQRGGDRIHEVQYLYDNDRYVAANLSLLADHIHRGKVISDMALQRVPHQIVWVVDTAGGLSGYTYERKNEVAGWHRHPSEGAAFQSVCVCRGSGSEDHVYLAATRYGRLVVEAFGAGCMTTPTLANVWLDGAVKVSSTDTTAADSYDGDTVSVTYNGQSWRFIWDGYFSRAHSLLVESEEAFHGVYYFNPNLDRWVKKDNEDLGDMSDFLVSSGDGMNLYSGGVIVATVGEFPPPLGQAAAVVLASGASGGELFIRVGDPFSMERTLSLDGEWLAWFPDNNGVLKYRNYSLQRTMQRETHSGVMKWTQRAFTGLLLYYATTGNADPTAVVWTAALGGAGLNTPATWSNVGVDEILVGFSYASIYQPMPFHLDMANGTSRTREMRIHRVVVDVEESYGGKIGPEIDKLLPIHNDNNPHTGETEKSFPGSTDTTGDVFIVADSPAPFVLRGITVKFNVYGDNG